MTERQPDDRHGELVERVREGMNDQEETDPQSEQEDDRAADALPVDVVLGLQHRGLPPHRDARRDSKSPSPLVNERLIAAARCTGPAARRSLMPMLRCIK